MCLERSVVSTEGDGGGMVLLVVLIVKITEGYEIGKVCLETI